MNRTIAPAPIRKTVTVRATPEKAFRVFTDGIDRWWPRSHHIGQGELKKAVLEPRQGGRWYGFDETGAEEEWGEVLAWEPPFRVLLAWRIDAAFKYDPKVGSEVEVRFADLGDGTVRVDLEHRRLDELGAGVEQALAGMDTGWGFILGLYKTTAES